MTVIEASKKTKYLSLDETTEEEIVKVYEIKGNNYVYELWFII